MRNSSKSFAHQYGISQKNIATNPSIGIGLNPNLNIQDEYVQNLLKQTHFLNMEIKLIKQKQKQNKGMGIMGLLNKDMNPVVTHAVTSNNKYSEMKNNLSLMVNKAEVQYLKLDDQNFAVKAQRDFVEKVSLKEQENNIKNKIYVENQLVENNNFFRQNQKRLIDVRQQSDRIKDNFNRIFRDWKQLTTKQNTKKLFRQINGVLQKQFQDMKGVHAEYKMQKFLKNKQYLDEEDKKNRQDPNYIQLLQENQNLHATLIKSQKDLFDKNYKVKEMEQLKKLCIRNKDYQAESKKQAAQQAQKLKKKLADRKAEFDVKLKQSISGLQTNDQVRLHKGRVARKDKQINDLRKKVQISEKNFKTLRDQVERLGLNLDEFKTLNLGNQNKQKQLTIIKNNGIAQMNDTQNEYDKLEGELKSTRKLHLQTRTKFEQLDQERVYLQAKEQYLSQQVNLDEGMKSIKIDQLSNLMHNNSGLNTTIQDVMQKWEQIRRFSRQQPGQSRGNQ